MVFRGARVAVYLDGCFWHGCPLHYNAPKANRGFWAEKVARNRERDQKVTASLQGAGWLVLRFWEHEDAEVCADIVCAAVRSRTASA